MFKKRATTASPTTDVSISGQPNPYLNARRTWNENTATLISQRQTWQVIGILSLLIALAGVGGMIHIGQQSKFIPYVIEVDKFGGTQAAGPVEATSNVDIRIVHAAVAEFITDARLVTPDIILQNRSIHRIFAKLSPNDPSRAKMTEWLAGNPEQTPFKRAATETVTAEIRSVIPQSPTTWQVEWTENVRDRKGLPIGKQMTMRALVTIYIAGTTSSTSDEEMRRNPMGIFISDFSWSQII